MDEYIKRSDAIKAYKISTSKDKHRTVEGSLVHEQEHRHILYILDKLPAADVAEVVHGEWIITEEILETIRECSCCHCKTYYPKPLNFNVRKSPYCEDCGAKMDGENSA